MEQKITRLFALGETFANLRFVWFDSYQIFALVRSVCDNVCSTFKNILFDSPRWQLLRRMAPASSSRDSASVLRDGGPIAAAGSSLHVIALIILLALIVAAVGGGDLILQRRLQSRLDISGAPYTRHRPFRRGPDKVSDTLTGQGVVPPNASRSRGAGGTGTGAARGDPGEVRREANLTRIDPAAPVDCGTFHAARTERFFRGPARRLVSLSLQQRNWLRPGRRNWPCCRARH